MLALLRGANVEAHLVLTDSRAHAEKKARQAVLAGCDTIFACGGDGTIHNMIQVLANTSVALAILPMGTANALAHDLGLPMNISAAAQAALHGVPRRVALGRVQFLDLEGDPAPASSLSRPAREWTPTSSTNSMPAPSSAWA